MPPNIHPTSIVSDKAKIGKNVSIGPFSIIGEDVQIGDGCQISNNVKIEGKTVLEEEVYVGSNSIIGIDSNYMDFESMTIETSPANVYIGANTKFENNITIKGNTTMGESNMIGAYSSIGFPSQSKKFGKEPTYVVMGSGNQIREYVSIQCGSVDGSGTTRVGSYNLILVYSHLAHDTLIGDHCALSNSTNLAGHVEMGSYVVTGGFACFHQFCRVGDYTMVGGMSGVYQDLAPYMLCTGHRAKLYGINLVGLQRNGYSSEEVQQAQQIYSLFFASGLAPFLAKKEVQNQVPDGKIKKIFLEFVEKSKRGLVAKEVP